LEADWTKSEVSPCISTNFEWPTFSNMNILFMRTQTLCHRIEKKLIKSLFVSFDQHFSWCHFYLILNEIKVSLNRNGLLFKKVTFKILNTIEFHKHDVNIFINGTWQKYAGNIGWLFKITRLLELRFWPTRNRSQPSQGNYFAL
jgi:hypothetical protein